MSVLKIIPSEFGFPYIQPAKSRSIMKILGKPELYFELSNEQIAMCKIFSQVDIYYCKSVFVSTPCKTNSTCQNVHAMLTEITKRDAYKERC